MIIDSQTNYLYLADTLQKKYKKFYHSFIELLNDINISFELILNTNDVWAVDYMPIQVSKDKFVQFVYNPDYFRNYKSLIKYITNNDLICRNMNLNTFKSELIVDGGNVIKYLDKVIMTEKVFAENPHLSSSKIINELEKLFEVDKIIFIPQDPNDETGHADGMVRFYEDDCVLINAFLEEDSEIHKRLKTSLKEAGLKIIEIPYHITTNQYNYQAIGVYINYLQMNNIIVVPTFGIPEDDKTVKQFEELFAGQTIATINCKDIAKQGGVLNCITWNILNN